MIDTNSMPSSLTPIRLTNSASQPLQEAALQNAIAKGADAIRRGDAHAAVRDLKFDYKQFGSPGKIADNVKQDTEDTFSELITQNLESHLIDNRRFGNFLVMRCIYSMDVEDIDATVIWHLMSGGFAEDLSQFRDYFTYLEEDQLIELLTAKNSKG